ncbi:MAG: hypothetical protein ACE5HS_21445 [bacterium]
MNSQKKTRTVLLLMAMILLNSCYAPSPIYRFKSGSDDTLWIFGKEFTRKADDNLEIAVAFERTYRGNFVLDVEVANLSEQTILVTPEKFYYQPIYQNADTAASRQVFAVDPEVALFEIEKERAKENADYKSSTAVNTTLSVLDLFYHIATIGKEKTEQEIVSDELNHHNLQADRIDTKISHDDENTHLNDMRDQWEQTALRRTTLGPQQSVQGLVHFPITDKAQSVQLVFPIGESTITFLFLQSKFKVD